MESRPAWVLAKGGERVVAAFHSGEQETGGFPSSFDSLSLVGEREIGFERMVFIHDDVVLLFSLGSSLSLTLPFCPLLTGQFREEKRK